MVNDAFLFSLLPPPFDKHVYCTRFISVYLDFFIIIVRLNRVIQRCNDTLRKSFSKMNNKMRRMVKLYKSVP